MTRQITLALATVAALFAATAAHADSAYWDKDESPMVAKSGDLLQIALPLAALGMTYLMRPVGDTGAAWRGNTLLIGDGFDMSMSGAPRHDLALGFARMEVAVYGLKYGINERRPNGSDHSFPSGHTAAAFLGAEFVRKEYGWGWGGPAYALASYVGWTRVVSGNHWPRDVFAGAAIGILSNYDLSDIETRLGRISIVPLLRSTPRPDDFSALSSYERDANPLSGDNSVGLQLNFQF